MATSYDEEVTPDIDPPLIEPPPPATLLGRIFAHRRDDRTVVRAPLVRVEPEPEAPPAPAVATGQGWSVVHSAPHAAWEPPPAPVAEPVREPAAEPVAQPVAGPQREQESEQESEQEQEQEQEQEREPARAQPAAARVASRYCATCGDRVPVAPDGLHCRLGHRLSPAHARSRGWLHRRRSH